MEQQVRKVLYEDLMSVGRYRKPENVLRFFVYLSASGRRTEHDQDRQRRRRAETGD